MFKNITKGIAKLFGTKSDRDIKDVIPYVEKINNEFEKLREITDDELREKTNYFKEFIQSELRKVDNQMEEIERKLEREEGITIADKEAYFLQLDELEKQRNKELETTLLRILPEGFATVKETARRLKENQKLVVKATHYDRELAAKYTHVEIKGDDAIWSNKWMVAGNEIEWSMMHYDVQLIGGIVLHQGKIAEMATGEGKTLVATLPAYLNALSERGVHIITVNDYLAKRDAEWNAPIFQFHGLRVDCIDKYEPNSLERKKAYLADITYGTNNEFGFDYLRDNMSRNVEELVQRKHHYTMIDEVDSVLIDEARTPLIISGPVPKGDQHEFYELKFQIQKLVDEQRKIVGDFLISGKKLIKENSAEAGLFLFRAHRGLPKYKPLIKFLSESGVKQTVQKTENIYLAENQKRMPEADEPLLFVIDEKLNSVDLTEKGINFITKEKEDQNFFILPDIGMEISDLEKNTALDESEKLHKKDEIINDYNTKSQRIHSINQLLKAYCMYEKDTEYIVVDGKVKIVDEQTGRVMEGRRYSDGLHQAIEAKENVKVEDATQTYATITLQNFFRMYHKLSGMTGTAETEAGEFYDIYKLDVVVIPTNKPIQRKDENDKVYKTIREKFNAVTDEIIKLTQEKRPVLVGTTSVEISELLSRMLKMRGIKHQVLNAKQHAREADIVAEAGNPGAVTIATNMAGRGTDIKLTEEVKNVGGLAIIGTERHESRRVDRQLRGRSGRQGDLGSSQFYVSLEDNLMRLFMSDSVARIMDKLGLKEGEVIQHSMITKSIERAQKKVEENNFATRKNLLEYDDVMNNQREVIYKRRRNALYGDRLELDMLNMIYDTCEDLITSGKSEGDSDQLRINILSKLGLDFEIDQEKLTKMEDAILAQELYKKSVEYYRNKNHLIIEKSLPILKDILKTRGKTLEYILVPFSNATRQVGAVVNLKNSVETEGKHLIEEMEKLITLSVIDLQWKEHLRAMDDLRQSVRNAVYEQKDPLLIYKFEGFELFSSLINKINQETVSFLVKAEIPVSNSEEVKVVEKTKSERNYKEQKEESGSVLNPNGSRGNEKQQVVQPIKSQKIASRNQRVSVQYVNGTVKKDVKYKQIETDLKENKCVLLH